MNPRIRNEIRSLAPALACFSMLSLLAFWVGFGWLVIPIHLVGCVIVGVLGFGRDLIHQTTLQGIAQPIPRAAIWNEKMLVVGATLFVLAIEYAAIMGIVAYRDHPTATIDILLLQATGFLAELFALGVGVSFTLLTRNLIASFWLVFAAALLVGWLINIVVARTPLSIHESLIQSLAFFAIGIGGLLHSRRLFLEYEDADPFATYLNFSLQRRSASNKSGTAEQFRKAAPVGSLLKKELSLQFVNLIFLCVAWLIIAVAAGATYLSAPDQINFGVQLSPWWSIVALAKGICCITPFLIGATAFAEENRFGTAQWHLTMPASLRLQWIVKVGTAVVLGLITGGFLFFAVDAISSSMAGKPVTIILPDDGDAQSALAKFGIYFVVPVVSALIGLYASYFASNFLQSLSLSALVVGSVTAFWFLLEWGFIMPRNTLTFGAVLAVLGPLLLFASYRNFTGAHPIPRCLRHNIIGLSAILAMTTIACGVTRNHAWELITVPSPTDEEFAQTVGNNKPVIVGRFGTAAALGPDGSIWWIGLDLSLPFYEEPKIINSPQRVGSGTNWIDVSPTFHGLIALKDAGTLWRVGQNRHYFKNSGITNTPAFTEEGVIYTPTLISFGAPIRWATVSARDGSKFVGISKDGRMHDVVTGDLIDTDSDWVDVVVGYQFRIALKTDGSIWFSGEAEHLARLGLVQTDRSDSLAFTEIRPASDIVEISKDFFMSELVATHRDGSKTVWSAETPQKNTKYQDLADFSAGWSSSAGHWGSVLVKTDGSVETQRRTGYQFDRKQYRGYYTTSEPASTRWPGNNWTNVELGDYFDFGMTKDGTLWVYGYDLTQIDLLRDLDDLKHPILHPSPRPRPIGRLVAPENLQAGERD